jgi:hypothetical protein
MAATIPSTPSLRACGKHSIGNGAPFSIGLISGSGAIGSKGIIRASEVIPPLKSGLSK